MPSRIYWDSCVWISLHQREAGRFDACNAIIQRSQKGEIVIVTSAFTLAEVCRIKGSPATPESQGKLILDYFEHSFIVVRQLDRATGVLANQLTRTHGLMPGDAVHAATAIAARVDCLHTYDTKKDRRRGLLRHNGAIGNPPLKIEVPPDPDTATPLLAGVEPLGLLTPSADGQAAKSIQNPKAEAEAGKSTDQK